MSFEKLIDVIKQARLKHPSMSRRMSEGQAMGRWDDAVGSIIAKYAIAKLVRDRVLWVEVGHPIWRSELHHRKSQILEILNREIPENEKLVDILFLDPKPRFKNPFRPKSTLKR